MNTREKFYHRTVSEFIRNRDASILVCAGGRRDKAILESCGYTNVTISNLDDRMQAEDYAPFKWKYENAEQLSLEDGSFDYVVTHAAIHHASSPHRVLTEMYRVARKGILAFESRDSCVMRLMERLGLTQVYELGAVCANDGKYGGVNNTAIPNHVFRWTEREIEKTIHSYAPYAQHSFGYRHGTAFPLTPSLERNALKYTVLTLARPLFWLFTRAFPKQQNLFAFYVDKPVMPDQLFAWLYLDDEQQICFNKQWALKKYRFAA